MSFLLTSRFAPVLMAATLVAAGIVLLLERARIDGILRLWPLIFVVAGAAAVGSGAMEDRDDGWWLIGTGFRVLLDTFAPVLRGAAPLVIVTAGLVALRRALTDVAAPVRGNSRVN